MNIQACASSSSADEERNVPLYLSPVAAGFPSPADDYIDQKLDLHSHLVRNPAATFFLRAQGDSMIGAGIHDGDLLVVDRSLEAAHNRVAIVALDGELTVKRLVYRHEGLFLVQRIRNTQKLTSQNVKMCMCGAW